MFVRCKAKSLVAGGLCLFTLFVRKVGVGMSARGASAQGFFIAPLVSLAAGMMACL